MNKCSTKFYRKNEEEVNQIRKDKAYIKGDWNVFVQEMYITKALKIM